MYKLFERVRIVGKEHLPQAFPGRKHILTDLIKREMGIIAWNDHGFNRSKGKPVVTYKKRRKHG